MRPSFSAAGSILPTRASVRYLCCTNQIIYLPLEEDMNECFVYEEYHVPLRQLTATLKE